MDERNAATSVNTHGLVPAQARAREEQRTQYPPSQILRLFTGARP
jgi:hypothetical protein